MVFYAAKLKVNAASPGHVKTPFNNFTGIRTLQDGAAVYLSLATLPEDGPCELQTIKSEGVRHNSDLKI
mgnify:CR=1 FL=1